MQTGMGRPLRIRIAGLSRHVTQRGNNKSDIFRCDSDYRAFLAMLQDAADRFESDIHGYAAMTNHVHLLITPRTPTAVERTMQVVGAKYALYFNRRYARTGALFEGRYKSTVVDDERYWINCLRYIELNPVRAGLVASPDEYRWSSHRANALGAVDKLLTPHSRYLDLGTDSTTRQHTWRTMCTDGLSAEELDEIRFAVFCRRVEAATTP